MSLYANAASVKKTIEEYCDVRQCRHCRRYYSEIANVGTWACKYHPGEYDRLEECYTCCGERKRTPNMTNMYSGWSSQVLWSGSNMHEGMSLFSAGCKGRDCQPMADLSLPKDVIFVEDIATLVPYMDPPIKKRPGFCKAPLRLLRVEPFPKNVWFLPPPE